MIKLWLNISLTMNVHAEQAEPWSWKSKLHWVYKYTLHWQIIGQFPSLTGTVQGPGVMFTFKREDRPLTQIVECHLEFLLPPHLEKRRWAGQLLNICETFLQHIQLHTIDYAEQSVATWNQNHCSKVQTFKLVAWGNLFAEPQAIELTKLRSWSSRVQSM